MLTINTHLTPPHRTANITMICAAEQKKLPVVYHAHSDASGIER